jgi:hypothetical protein
MKTSNKILLAFGILCAAFVAFVIVAILCL